MRQRIKQSNWYFIMRADLAYGGNSNESLNGSLLFDYRFTGWGSVFMGYRAMDIEYKSGSGEDRYNYHALQQGPVLGLNLNW